MKSKKFVMVGFVLLAAITMVLLPLSGCKTEVDTSSPQQEQPGDSTGTGENAGTGGNGSTGENAGTKDNTSGGADSGMGGGDTGDNPSAGNGDSTGDSEEKPGSGESNTELQPCSHQPEADDGDCTTEVKCTLCDEVTTPGRSHDPNEDDGDCTTEVKCTLCDEVTTPGRSHDPNEDDGNCLTEVRCNNCDVVTTEAREAHEGGTPTCIGQACEVCGTFYGDKDENNHIKTSEVAYYYTWSETAPTSTKNYTCLHCGKAIEETASPSVWSVGDKVTYVAKDGNSYVSTVGEVTDGKAVLVSDEQWSTGKRTISKEELLAIVETKGARVPTLTEAVWTNIFEPWAYTTLPISYGGNADKTISVVYSSDVLSVVVNKETYLGIYNSTINYYFSKNNTWVGRYVWDVEFTTAE